MEKIPTSWIDTVEKAISVNENTVQNKSMNDMALGLYDVLEKMMTEKENELKQLHFLKES